MTCVWDTDQSPSAMLPWPLLIVALEYSPGMASKPPQIKNKVHNILFNLGCCLGHTQWYLKDIPGSMLKASYHMLCQGFQSRSAACKASSHLASWVYSIQHRNGFIKENKTQHFPTTHLYIGLEWSRLSMRKISQALLFLYYHFCLHTKFKFSLSKCHLDST